MKKTSDNEILFRINLQKLGANGVCFGKRVCVRVFDGWVIKGECVFVGVWCESRRERDTDKAIW